MVPILWGKSNLIILNFLTLTELLLCSYTDEGKITVYKVKLSYSQLHQQLYIFAILSA